MMLPVARLRPLRAAALLLALAAPWSLPAAQEQDPPAESPTPVQLQPIRRGANDPAPVRLNPVIRNSQAPAAAPTPAPAATPRPRPRPRPRAVKPAPQPAPLPATAIPRAADAPTTPPALELATPIPATAPGAPAAQLRELMTLPDTPEALATLSDFAQTHPEPALAVPALLRAAGISIALDDWAGALALYEDAAVQATESAQQALAEEGIIRAMTRLGRYETAERGWDQLRERHPDHLLAAEAQVDIGLMLALRGRDAEARDVWKIAATMIPTLDPAQAARLSNRLELTHALADELAGKPRQASQIYQRLLARAADTEEAQLARARLADLERHLLAAP